MPPDPKRRREKFMALLLALATRVERGVAAILRPILLRVMLLIRRILEALSPTGQFRLYEYQRLQTPIYEALRPLQEALRTYLPPALAQLIPPVREQAQAFLEQAQVAPQAASPHGPPYAQPLAPQAPPASVAELAARTSTGTKPLADVIEQLPARVAVDLDRTVRTSLLREETTSTLLDKVIKVVTRQGEQVPVLRTGSFANRVFNQLKNTITGSTWSVINQNVQAVWQPAGVSRWVWVAVLDPKTCPVCAPLDGQARSAITDFPYQPPVHPNCRCSILPT